MSGIGKPTEIKQALYPEALSYMGYEVVGLGEIDIRAIKESGKSAFEEVGIPHICANVVYSDTRKPLLKKPYVIKKLPSGLRVAVIGIMGTLTLHAQLAKDTGVDLLPPDETLRKTMNDLKGKADLFVVLAHTGYQDAKKLAAAVPGIHVMLSSHPTPVNTDFERIGDTILMHGKASCKYVGKLVLDIDSEGKITKAEGIEDPLDERFAKDAKMQKLIDDTEAAITKYYNSNSHRFPPNTPGAKQDLDDDSQPFVGSQRCIGCHLSIFQTWQKTSHAGAFEDLSKRGPDGKTNAECLACHTTGYGQKGGFRTEADTPYLRNVQCESCHGPGIRHLRNPSEKGYGATTEQTCLRCHDGTNSPKFDYEKYREKIAHKARPTK